MVAREFKRCLRAVCDHSYSGAHIEQRYDPVYSRGSVGKYRVAVTHQPDELESFDFGGRFDARFKGERIPTLDEVLALAARSERLLLNVEIKDMTHEAVDKTIAALRHFELCERSVIACFDARVIRYVKKAYPEMRTQGFPGRYMAGFVEDDYDIMFGMGIPICWGDSTPERIRADVEFARSRGILAWLFVADTTEAVRASVEFGADNITGNNPEVALSVLRELGLHK